VQAAFSVGTLHPLLPIPLNRKPFIPHLKAEPRETHTVKSRLLLAEWARALGPLRLGPLREGLSNVSQARRLAPFG